MRLTRVGLDRPRRSGTATPVGLMAIVSSISVPSSTVAPSAGSCLVTVPTAAGVLSSNPTCSTCRPSGRGGRAGLLEGLADEGSAPRPAAPARRRGRRRASSGRTRRAPRMTMARSAGDPEPRARCRAARRRRRRRPSSSAAAVGARRGGRCAAGRPRRRRGDSRSSRPGWVARRPRRWSAWRRPRRLRRPAAAAPAAAAPAAAPAAPAAAPAAPRRLRSRMPSPARSSPRNSSSASAMSAAVAYRPSGFVASAFRVIASSVGGMPAVDRRRARDGAGEARGGDRRGGVAGPRPAAR